MLLALAVSLLTSCATASFNANPPLREYSRDFQRKLADEVARAPTDAAFPVALQDCAVLRAEVRASK